VAERILIRSRRPPHAALVYASARWDPHGLRETRSSSRCAVSPGRRPRSKRQCWAIVIVEIPRRLSCGRSTSRSAQGTDREFWKG
jgi:hypothetical protein